MARLSIKTIGIVAFLESVLFKFVTLNRLYVLYIYWAITLVYFQFHLILLKRRISKFVNHLKLSKVFQNIF